MHAVPTVIAAAELRRQDFVNEGIWEQWIADALGTVERSRQLDTGSTPLSLVSALSAAVGAARSRLNSLAASVLALSSQ